MLLSINLIEFKLRVVKRGFSKSIRLPLPISKTAMSPLPLPETDGTLNSGRPDRLTDRVGS